MLGVHAEGTRERVSVHSGGRSAKKDTHLLVDILRSVASDILAAYATPRLHSWDLHSTGC